MSSTTPVVKRLYLPRFRAALKPHAACFDRATYWRYGVGALPAGVLRLMENPELLDALAADARALRDAAAASE